MSNKQRQSDARISCRRVRMLSAIHAAAPLRARRCAVLAIVCAAAGCGERPVVPILGASVERGKEAIHRHGCVACHTIPGIAGPASNVGPPLDHIAKRAYIAGVLPNMPSEMIRWLIDPPQVAPRTAMPAMQLTGEEARDIAAYLYTLD